MEDVVEKDPFVIKIPKILDLTNVSIEFIGQLENLWRKKGQKILVDLSDVEFITISGMAAITSFCKYGVKHQIISRGAVRMPKAYTVKRYLKTMEFIECLKDKLDQTYSKNFGKKNYIKLVEIDSKEKVEDITNRIVDICDENGILPTDWPNRLKFPLVEILENSANHSISTIKPIVCVQHFPKLNELEIAVVDCGVGFKESLKKNVKYSYLTSDIESINLALQYGVTSTPIRNTGKGLSFTNEILMENEGNLVIHSGEGYCDNRKKITVPYWHGSLVGMRFKLNNPIELQKIFNKYVTN